MPAEPIKMVHRPNRVRRIRRSRVEYLSVTVTGIACSPPLGCPAINSAVEEMHSRELAVAASLECMQPRKAPRRVACGRRLQAEQHTKAGLRDRSPPLYSRAIKSAIVSKHERSRRMTLSLAQKPEENRLLGPAAAGSAAQTAITPKARAAPARPADRPETVRIFRLIVIGNTALKTMINLKRNRQNRS